MDCTDKKVNLNYLSAYKISTLKPLAKFLKVPKWYKLKKTDLVKQCQEKIKYKWAAKVISRWYKKKYSLYLNHTDFATMDKFTHPVAYLYDSKKQGVYRFNAVSLAEYFTTQCVLTNPYTREKLSDSQLKYITNLLKNNGNADKYPDFYTHKQALANQKIQNFHNMNVDLSLDHIFNQCLCTLTPVLNLQAPITEHKSLEDNCIVIMTQIVPNFCNWFTHLVNSNHYKAAECLKSAFALLNGEGQSLFHNRILYWTSRTLFQEFGL